jgi:hypothetical protein
MLRAPAYLFSEDLSEWSLASFSMPARWIVCWNRETTRYGPIGRMGVLGQVVGEFQRRILQETTEPRDSHRCEA